jgi:filamentous hemagglutinin
LHPDEKTRIKEPAKGDAKKEARLTAAGCAVVKCSAEFAVGSPECIAAKAVENLGNSPDYAVDRELLTKHTATIGNRDQVTYPLFQYGTGDKVLDTVQRVANTYQVSTRAGGTAQAVGCCSINCPVCRLGV